MPVGAFLSGGLDSSAIVAYAREFYDAGRLKCFSIAYEVAKQSQEGIVEDLPYAKRVADHLDVDLEVIDVSPKILMDLERLVYQLDEPQADPAALNALFICQRARDNGITVLLSGAGGDDVFSGYRRHYALELEKYWAWMPKGFRKMLSKGSQLFPGGNAFGRRFSKAFRYAHLSENERIVSYFQWITTQRILNVLNPELRQAVVESPPESVMLEALGRLPGRLPQDTPALNRMLHLDANYFLIDHNFNYTDKMSMAVGVEARVPFLDPDLMEFAAKLPPHYKQHGKNGKWIFKKAMEGMLPNDVIYRPKSGFGVPLRDWMARDLKPLFCEVFSEKSLKVYDVFDPKGVQKLWKDHHAGRIDAAYPLLSIVCIELWLRAFVPGV